MASDNRVVLGRYQVSNGKPLGTGGWCVVHRGEDLQTGQGVAIKSFSSQARRDLGEAGLAMRFAREIATFKKIGLALDASEGMQNHGSDPRRRLVNLLDYSRHADTGQPGAAEDGEYYTVLELADEALDVYLQRRSDASLESGLDEIRSLAAALAGGLACMHSKGLVHLDVKPENVMKFGGLWKLIDLEGCLPQDETGTISGNEFTPLYASPELASFALGEADAPKPAESMDMWAVGVVLLDFLARACAFQDMKSGFDAAALFEEEAVPFESWYRWLADSEPILPSDFLDDSSSGKQILAGSAELRELLGQLLSKDAASRPSASEMLQHPLLRERADAKTSAEVVGHIFQSAQMNVSAAQTPCSKRANVEKVFQSHFDSLGRSSGLSGCFSRAAFLRLLELLGFGTDESTICLDSAFGKGMTELHYRDFLAFVYSDGK
eukprot:TRINITY_DN17852_c0_g1_i1.p1 TRINITY_DN17852_c0_g1~~TRINITY_DN17852_c0_g1_i1.p1  ORF type:complete len:438 (-),score=50.08 TRINITY_DN17852_c0_g1_i1:120-1433(-)